MKNMRVIASDQKHKDKSFTVKQWLVYYYLMSICKWNGAEKEDHYFIYKRNFNISAASRLLDISRPTIYSTINALKKLQIIEEYEDYYLIEIPSVYAKIDQKTISFLLQYQKFLGVELIRTYVILSRIYQHQELDQWFNKATLSCIMGHNINDASYYPQIELYLGFLSYWNLVEFKIKNVKDGKGIHKEYMIIKIFCIDDAFDGFEIDTGGTVNKEMVDRIKAEIQTKIK